MVVIGKNDILSYKKIPSFHFLPLQYFIDSHFHFQSAQEISEMGKNAQF